MVSSITKTYNFLLKKSLLFSVGAQRAEIWPKHFY
jgi:hypothetical protein